MADLIDRQKIKARFEPWLKVKGYSEGELNIIRAVLYEITIMPSAERHGKWIHDGYDFPHGVDWMHCSECGKIGVYCPAAMTNYCPHCGARMDGEQDG